MKTRIASLLRRLTSLHESDTNGGSLRMLPRLTEVASVCKIFHMTKKRAPARDRKPRADGQRNRARLLDVAKQEFTRAGANASLEAIAKQAGVGPGTLYRHFPTREDLLQAVY